MAWLAHGTWKDARVQLFRRGRGRERIQILPSLAICEQEASCISIHVQFVTICGRGGGGGDIWHLRLDEEESRYTINWTP